MSEKPVADGGCHRWILYFVNFTKIGKVIKITLGGFRRRFDLGVFVSRTQLENSRKTGSWPGTIPSVGGEGQGKCDV